MYDYLIVGSGFYGAVCAHQLKKRAIRYWLLNAVIMLQAMHIPKIIMGYKCTNMERIYSIPMIRKFGTMLILLLNLTVSLTLP